MRTFGAVWPNYIAVLHRMYAHYGTGEGGERGDSFGTGRPGGAAGRLRRLYTVKYNIQGGKMGYAVCTWYNGWDIIRSVMGGIGTFGTISGWVFRGSWGIVTFGPGAQGAAYGAVYLYNIIQ